VDKESRAAATAIRVLYVIDDLGAAGAERSLAAMAPHYAIRGIQLDVAYLRHLPGVQADLEAAGAELHSLEGRGGRLGWMSRARALTASLRPDLVHTTLFEADVAGRIGASLARVPVVSSLVNVHYSADQTAAPGMRRWKVRGAQLLDALTAQRVVRFHALSRNVADEMSRRLRVPRHRVDVIPRGRDPARLGQRDPLRRARVRAELGVNETSPLLLAVARHEHQKGLDVLLEAMPRVLSEEPRVRLLVAGREGNQTALLRAMADRLGLNGATTLLGAREDVADLLCAADVMVIPSRWEGLSSVLIEAMAMQAPVVASDLPTIRDAVSDGDTARLVPAGDPVRLAAALTTTLGDPAAAERAQRAHRRFLEHFTIDHVVDQMHAFYQRALAR
jgi:glycosyltransferase involved in cell wall biosynthesis